MEFKRFEVRRILRHVEKIEESEDVAAMLDAIRRHGIRCSAKVRNIGAPMRECAVLDVNEEGSKVLLYSRSPSKIKAWFQFSEVEHIEVESALDLMVEDDQGGRWARIL